VDADFASVVDNSFIVRASGGVGINTSDPAGNALNVNGSVRMSGFQLGSVASSGQVLTSDGSGVGSWQDLPRSLLTLPYAGTVSYAEDAFRAVNTGSGSGLTGVGASGNGVSGSSQDGIGVSGASATNYGVSGVSGSSYGVYGSSASGEGLHGDSHNGNGVYGGSVNSNGVYGTGYVGVMGMGGQYGVGGQSDSNNYGTAVYGIATATTGVTAGGSFRSQSPSGNGVYAINTNGGNGVYSESNSGIAGYFSSSSGYAGYFNGVTYFNGSAYVNGNIQYTGSLTQISDARYKTNIAIFGDALDAVLHLRGVTFNFKRDEFKNLHFASGRQIGFIAQEVEKVLPEVVSRDRDGYKSVAYANIVPVLVEAIKQQQRQMAKMYEQNRTLQRQTSALQAQITTLRTNMQRLQAALATPRSDRQEVAHN
jgi:hypothetical protein